ncbi:hypothetical protein ILYODFUR_025005 [Ilyodon furcidens]|uniref:Uncharacterized protein n=1 Tax=Ilyodon furcidens TaxID=33524 RepID=A0ABV0UX83_9TELE
MKNRMFRTTGQGTRSGSLGGDTSRPKAKSISLFTAVLGNQNLLDLKGLCLWKTVPEDKNLDYVWRTLDSLFNFTFYRIYFKHLDLMFVSLLNESSKHTFCDY